MRSPGAGRALSIRLSGFPRYVDISDGRSVLGILTAEMNDGIGGDCRLLSELFDDSRLDDTTEESKMRTH